MTIRLKPVALPVGVPERVISQGSARSGLEHCKSFVACCLGAAVLLIIKYYPLRPTRFVLSQYLWTVADGSYRRTVVSSLAALAHGFEPDRILPVVDLVSVIEVSGLSMMLVWAAVRLAPRRIPRLGLLLLLCSGAVPHLLATRGSQDGFAALALIGLALALGARRIVLSALFGALAVMIHEASIFYVISLCGLRLALADAEKTTRGQDVVARLATPYAFPEMAGFGAAVLTLIAVMGATHISPDIVAETCRRYVSIATAPGLEALRGADAGTPAQQWSAVCGLQFKMFASSPAFFVRSIPLGAMFAPVVLVTLVLALRARLTLALRLGIVASLLVPALLPLVATDITRFWSYMNLTSLYGLVLLEPHIRDFGRVKASAFLVGVLVLWVGVAAGIEQWPTGWPQQPTALPDSIAARIPTFRDAICAASRQGVCDKPVTSFR